MVIKEPRAGYWWVRRDDGRHFVIEVKSNNGKKSIVTFSNTQQTPLNVFRRNFTFLRFVGDPERGPEVIDSMIDAGCLAGYGQRNRARAVTVNLILHAALDARNGEQ